MKFLSVFVMSLSLIPALAQSSESDFLTQNQIRIESPRSDQVLSRISKNLMGVFDRFRPALTSDSTVLSPWKVRGSRSNPLMQISVQKCVMGFACGSVALVGEASMEASGGSCTKNYRLHIDLSRSSDMVSGTYDALDANLCYKKLANGSGSLTLSQSARRASRFEAGSSQEMVLGFMKQQAPRIAQAFQEAVRMETSTLMAEAN